MKFTTLVILSCSVSCLYLKNLQSFDFVHCLITLSSLRLSSHKACLLLCFLIFWVGGILREFHSSC